jgi:hypothetical protein
MQNPEGAKSIGDNNMVNDWRGKRCRSFPGCSYASINIITIDAE